MRQEEGDLVELVLVPGSAFDGDCEFTGEGDEFTVGDGLLKGALAIPVPVEDFQEGIVDDAVIGREESYFGGLECLECQSCFGAGRSWWITAKTSIEQRHLDAVWGWEEQRFAPFVGTVGCSQREQGNGLEVRDQPARHGLRLQVGSGLGDPVDEVPERIEVVGGDGLGCGG